MLEITYPVGECTIDDEVYNNTELARAMLKGSLKTAKEIISNIVSETQALWKVEEISDNPHLIGILYSNNYGMINCEFVGVPEFQKIYNRPSGINPNAQPNKVCEVCGQRFEWMIPQFITTDTREHFYCGLGACLRQNDYEKVPRVSFNKRTCEHCGIKLENKSCYIVKDSGDIEHYFCNSSHFELWKVYKEGPIQPAKHICENCGKSGATLRNFASSQVSHYFCNDFCREQWMSNLIADFNRLSQACRESKLNPTKEINRIRAEDGVEQTSFIIKEAICSYCDGHGLFENMLREDNGDNIRFFCNKECQDKFNDKAIRSSDADDVRYDLISPIGLRRLAERYALDSKKYGDMNWLKGFPASDLLKHLIKHIELWRSGDRSDDNLAGAAWGLFTLMHFEETRPDLIDMNKERWGIVN